MLGTQADGAEVSIQFWKPDAIALEKYLRRMLKKFALAAVVSGSLRIR